MLAVDLLDVDRPPALRSSQPVHDGSGMNNPGAAWSIPPLRFWAIIHGAMFSLLSVQMDACWR